MAPYRRPISRDTPATVSTNGIWKSISSMLVAGGFAAIIAGVFGLGGDMVKRPAAIEDRQCTNASEMVLDEAPNPYISRVELARLGGLAAARLEICLKGKDNDRALALPDLYRRDDDGNRPDPEERTARPRPQALTPSR